MKKESFLLNDFVQKFTRSLSKVISLKLSHVHLCTAERQYNGEGEEEVFVGLGEALSESCTSTQKAAGVFTTIQVRPFTSLFSHISIAFIQAIVHLERHSSA